VNNTSRFVRARYMQTLCWLEIHTTEHRLVFRDIEDTFAFVGLFFPVQARKSNTDIGLWKTETSLRTQLINNEYKASQFAYYRDWRSNKIMPPDFFTNSRDIGSYKTWDRTTRPLIAHLYKSGIIVPIHESDVPGQAISATDPMTGQETMFMDYHSYQSPSFDDLKHITDWQKVDLLGIAKRYVSELARFWGVYTNIPFCYN
jgi:hypothetical protein